MNFSSAVAEHDGMRDASNLLDARLDKMRFGRASIHVVLGYPRSDIGKAELVARLGLLLPDSFSIIKIDGFLNTNRGGQHPSRVRNDFVVYRKFHNHIAFGGPHLILNAQLMTEFFETYGECKEHLMFRPHLAKFFALRIHSNWVRLGRPNHLIIEVGGSFVDTEVNAYTVPGIRILQDSHSKVRLFLLAEAGYSGQSLKTKPLINAIQTARSYGLSFDTVFARLPLEFPDHIDLKKLASYAESKIRDAMVAMNSLPRVIFVPFFPEQSLKGYSELLANCKKLIFPPDRIARTRGC